MEFPESLLVADSANAAHVIGSSASGGTTWPTQIYNGHTSVVLRAENVVSPYTKTSRSETVAYFPQDFLQEGNATNYYTAGLNYWPIKCVNLKVNYSLVEKVVGEKAYTHRLVGMVAYKFN